jgi:hypothetical protein
MTFTVQLGPNLAPETALSSAREPWIRAVAAPIIRTESKTNI